MEVEGDVTRNIIDQLHSLYIPGDQMEGESGAIRNIIDELYSSDIQRDQIEVEISVTGRIIDKLHSSDIQGKIKVVLLVVSLMIFILQISKEIK